jgi:hypothetical protein
LTQAQDGSGATLIQGVPTQVELVADNTPLRTDNVEADGEDPRLDDNAGGLCHNLVVQGASPSMVECTASGDMVPAPRSMGVEGPWVAILLLPGSPNSPSPPVN